MPTCCSAEWLKDSLDRHTYYRPASRRSPPPSRLVLEDEALLQTLQNVPQQNSCPVRARSTTRCLCCRRCAMRSSSSVSSCVL